jgi:hypothetical protein
MCFSVDIFLYNFVLLRRTLSNYKFEMVKILQRIRDNLNFFFSGMRHCEPTKAGSGSIFVRKSIQLIRIRKPCLQTAVRRFGLDLPTKVTDPSARCTGLGTPLSALPQRAGFSTPSNPLAFTTYQHH